MTTSKKKSIWAIEDGEYSDYHVIGIFSSKVNAEMIRKITGGEIAEWPLDPAVKELNKGLTQWRVLMLRDGSTESCEQQDVSSYELGGRSGIWKRSEAPAYQGTNTPDALWATVWAKSVPHAVKIANEIRAGLIAGGKWK